jgi:hypothetical protein
MYLNEQVEEYSLKEEGIMNTWLERRECGIP